MSVLDEIQVTDTGDVEIRIIPPDSLSTDPDVLVTYPKGSPLGDLVCERYLRGIARRLGLRASIVSLVHSGEQLYTVHTLAGECAEVDGAADMQSLIMLNRIAGLVEGLFFWQHNIPSFAPDRRSPPYAPPGINRVRTQARRPGTGADVRWLPLPPADRGDPSSPRRKPVIQAPNRLRSA